MKRVPVAFAVLAAASVLASTVPDRAPAGDRPSISAADELEAGIFTELSALRARYGLDPLRLARGLSSAAHRQAREMARFGFCTHDSADGSSFWLRLVRFYGRPKGWRVWSVAENLACYRPGPSAPGAVSEWLASPSHRDNLLSRKFREVGLAAFYARRAPGEFYGEDVLIVVADFGVRR